METLKETTCKLEGLVNRREELSVKLFNKILANKHHLLHHRAPHRLPHAIGFSNFECRTDKRQNSFSPFVTLLVNNCLKRTS